MHLSRAPHVKPLDATSQCSEPSLVFVFNVHPWELPIESFISQDERGDFIRQDLVTQIRPRQRLTSEILFREVLERYPLPPGNHMGLYDFGIMWPPCGRLVHKDSWPIWYAIILEVRLTVLSNGHSTSCLRQVFFS